MSADIPKNQRHSFTIYEYFSICFTASYEMENKKKLFKIGIFGLQVEQETRVSNAKSKSLNESNYLYFFHSIFEIVFKYV